MPEGIVLPSSSSVLTLLSIAGTGGVSKDESGGHHDSGQGTAGDHGPAGDQL